MNKVLSTKPSEPQKPALVSQVRCPGCGESLTFNDDQVPDDVIDGHTRYGCKHPDAVVRGRLGLVPTEEKPKRRSRSGSAYAGRNGHTPATTSHLAKEQGDQYGTG